MNCEKKKQDVNNLPTTYVVGKLLYFIQQDNFVRLNDFDYLVNHKSQSHGAGTGMRPHDRADFREDRFHWI